MGNSMWFWGTGVRRGKKGNYFMGTGEQRLNFEGNRGTKIILGNREHKKTNFQFWGNRGTSQFIPGEQKNRLPPPPPTHTPGMTSLILPKLPTGRL